MDSENDEIGFEETVAPTREYHMGDQDNVKILQQTITDMNAEFGEKRAKFRTLFLQKEEELEAERRLRQKMDLELENLRMKVNERQMREVQEGEKASVIAKLREDLQKAAKLRDEMEGEWSQLCEDSQARLRKLEEQQSTYEVIILELNAFCEHSLQEMERTVRKLTIERTEIQKNIQTLEYNNDKLQGKHVAHSQMLQNESISLPNSVMELQEMVLGIKEELISVKIGKEEIEGELKFLRDRVQTEDEERINVEESFNTEIQMLRSQLKELEGFRELYESERNKYERTVTELKTKTLISEANSSQLLKHNSKLIEEKVTKNLEFLDRLEAGELELAEAKAKISTLHKELASSEELQRDLISLSKSLQIGLETIRQAETEVRWQHPDDISQCNTCKTTVNDSRDKTNCCHCGRIFCKNCLERTVRRGARDYHVCEFCHTVLAHNSAPYFSIQAPQQPD